MLDIDEEDIAHPYAPPSPDALPFPDTPLTAERRDVEALPRSARDSLHLQQHTARKEVPAGNRDSVDPTDTEGHSWTTPFQQPNSARHDGGDDVQSETLSYTEEVPLMAAHQQSKSYSTPSRPIASFAAARAVGYGCDGAEYDARSGTTLSELSSSKKQAKEPGFLKKLFCCAGGVQQEKQPEKPKVVTKPRPVPNLDFPSAAAAHTMGGGTPATTARSRCTFVESQQITKQERTKCPSMAGTSCASFVLPPPVYGSYWRAQSGLPIPDSQDIGSMPMPSVISSYAATPATAQLDAIMAGRHESPSYRGNTLNKRNLEQSVPVSQQGSFYQHGIGTLGLPTHRSITPRPMPATQKKHFTLVLDLDETLAHKRRGPLLARPFLPEFLQYLATLPQCEVVVWTAGVKQYAQQIVSAIDDYGVIQHCVYRHKKWYPRTYQERCVKNLALTGRNPEHTLIIDNSPESVCLNAKNGIVCTDFTGCGEDVTLRALIDVIGDLAESNLSVPEFVSTHPDLKYLDVSDTKGGGFFAYFLDETKWGGPGVKCKAVKRKRGVIRP